MYYKVVKCQNEKIESVLTFDPWCLQYQLGIPTKPNFPGSKLFVFNDLDCAKLWLISLWVQFWQRHPEQYLAIYQCEVENPTIAPCRCKNNSGSDLREFWIALQEDANGHRYYSNPYSMGFSSMPEGTYWADSVTLTCKEFIR